MSKFIIPDGVLTIGKQAFAECKSLLITKMPTDRKFILKFDNEFIKAHTIVNTITYINNAVLIENENDSDSRAWVMRTDIYPISDYDSCGIWEYSNYDYNTYVKPYI